MKKKISLVLAVASLVSMFSAFSVSAATPDVIHTGVKAFINNYPIQSYTINNHTVVSTEDIKTYGFRVDWDQNARALYITKDACKDEFTATGWEGVRCYEAYNGVKAYDTVATDIKVYVDNVLVPSYAVNKATYNYTILPDPVEAEQTTGVEMFINLADLVNATSYNWNIEKQYFADEKNSFLWITKNGDVGRWYTSVPNGALVDVKMNGETKIPMAHLTYTRAYEIAKWAVSSSVLSKAIAGIVVEPIRYQYLDPMYLQHDASGEYYVFDLVIPGVVGATVRVNQNGTWSFNVPAWVYADLGIGYCDC